MPALLSLPLTFLKFWYVDALLGLTHFFASLNHAFFQLFSLPLLIRTFFKPLKNEYRQGLVGFSIGMGIVVKTSLILVDLFLFLLLLSFEIMFMFAFLSWPFATALVLFV
ncbi:MAG: hypothetical protein HYV40_05890 [Candidatus Levybacteria bacterium]|nr:hypothetical protein [Candidatus Levybacteria bacterium]